MERRCPGRDYAEDIKREEPVDDSLRSEEAFPKSGESGASAAVTALPDWDGASLLFGGSAPDRSATCRLCRSCGMEGQAPCLQQSFFQENSICGAARLIIQIVVQRQPGNLEQRVDTMWRLFLLAFFLVIGCHNGGGAFERHPAERVNDPLLSLEEQQQRGRDPLTRPGEVGPSSVVEGSPRPNSR